MNRICAYCRKGDTYSYPAHTTIADELECTVRYLKRVIGEIEQKGFIKIEEWFDGKRQQSNRYHLNFNKYFPVSEDGARMLSAIKVHLRTAIDTSLFDSHALSLQDAYYDRQKGRLWIAVDSKDTEKFMKRHLGSIIEYLTARFTQMLGDIRPAKRHPKFKGRSEFQIDLLPTYLKDSD